MQMTIKKIAAMAVLTAVALIIFIVEAQIPLPIAIPGVKLGLANSVTLFALFYGRGKERSATSFTAVDVFLIFICRIMLGAILTGRIVTIIYSFTGGLLAFAAQVLVRKLVTNKQVWVCGAAGAVFHNIGQIVAAAVVTGTPAIAAYLPMLIIAGVMTGVLTGLIAQYTLDRLP